MSADKVRVTKLYGGSHPVGLIDPKVNMLVKQGSGFDRYITSVGDTTVGLAMTEGGTETGREYPFNLFITEAQATGTWSYPSGDGSIAFGRAGIWPNGVPEDLTASSTMMRGNGVPQNF